MRTRFATYRPRPIEWLEPRRMLAVVATDDTLATANIVDSGTPFGGSITLSDSAGDSDLRDFYRINLPLGVTNKFSARLYNLSADLQLALIHDFNNDHVVDPNELLKLSVKPG